MTRDEQIAHIEQHRAKFQKHQCYQPPFGHNGDVRGYFNMYGDDDSLYWDLCWDLGITPLEGCPGVKVEGWPEA
jgi:hypothetical protein